MYYGILLTFAQLGDRSEVFVYKILMLSRICYCALCLPVIYFIFCCLACWLFVTFGGLSKSLGYLCISSRNRRMNLLSATFLAQVNVIKSLHRATSLQRFRALATVLFWPLCNWIGKKEGSIRWLYRIFQAVYSTNYAIFQHVNQIFFNHHGEELNNQHSNPHEPW